MRVHYTLADYGDADRLYQCLGCGAITIVHPDAEHYIGPMWDELRHTAKCPSCLGSLEFALAYPDHYRCHDCGVVDQFLLESDRYPAGALSELLEGWDPYG